MQKALIVIGIVIVAVGLFWPWLSQIPLGRLPGDIVIERGGVKVYLPVMTCVVISVVLTVLVRVFGGR
ncbi:DUF2905 domain-containing protein [Parvularcula lutaonensis]|uniref:DUF2905 domain-containing protein n=1 Tax=Parvularcula lutaonensis TaxID=491923 RepID=A0ABV7MGG7_9PROT|nr:DUF2905 domain-containing protein [Parvularcula lutaonensis]GGY54248.1 hypothetical protein GCM10007148_24750 [Parvularcula lutaonensis]